MLYVINFDIKDNSRLDSFLQKMNEMGESMTYMQRCYFLRTPSDSPAKDDLYASLKALLSDEDLLLLIEVKLSIMQGWLPSSVVEWINNG